MTTPHQQPGSWCGRCFTYPQGSASFLPQILAAAALYGSFAAFSNYEMLRDSWINHAPEFLCLLIKTRSTSPVRFLGDDVSDPSNHGYGYNSDEWAYGKYCFGLTFHDEDYWDIDDDDTKWAWAIRMACLFPMFTTIVGGVATLVLWSATCFPLPSDTIRKIALSFFACVPMALLTLVSAATSICKRDYPSEDYPLLECKRNGTGIRLKYGGTTMIFVAGFYLAAGIATLGYRSVVATDECVRNDDNSTVAAAERHETAPLVAQSPEPITRMTVKHTPDGTVTSKETTFPDGTTTMEIIEDDTK